MGDKIAKARRQLKVCEYEVQFTVFRGGLKTLRRFWQTGPIAGIAADQHANGRAANAEQHTIPRMTNAAHATDILDS